MSVPVKIPSDDSRGLIADTIAELRWTWSGRRSWLLGIGFNLAIGLVFVGIAYYDPQRAFDIRTAAGLAVGLVMWVLADPVNTNQLGSEADRIDALLRSGFGLARALFVKNAALATLLLPLTIAISAGVRVLVHDQRAIPDAILSDIWIVLGWLAIGNVASVLAPYRTLPLTQRWQRRDTWAWWGMCQALPYLLFAVRAFVVEHLIRGLLRTDAPATHGAHDLPASLGLAICGVVLLLVSYGLCALYGRLALGRLLAKLAKQR